MGGSAFRGMVSCVLTVLFPFSLFAADSNAAMLTAVRNTPGAIGLIDVFSITQEVKVLKIDGKLPVEYGYILRGN